MERARTLWLRGRLMPSTWVLILAQPLMGRGMQLLPCDLAALCLIQFCLLSDEKDDSTYQTELRRSLNRFLLS